MYYEYSLIRTTLLAASSARFASRKSVFVKSVWSCRILLYFFGIFSYAVHAVEFDAVVVNGDEFTHTLAPKANITLRLNFSFCMSAGHINVQSLNLDVQNEIFGGNVDGNPRLQLLVNTLGLLPVVKVVDSYEWQGNKGTLFDFGGFNLVKGYQFLTINTSDHDTGTPWLISIVNDDTFANLTVPITVKSWCSDLPSCPLNCSGLGVCDGGKCHCEAGRGGTDCKTVVTRIANESRVTGSVMPGSWNYYSVKVPEATETSLVEMQRTSGDPVLFVQRKHLHQTVPNAASGLVSTSFPTVFDFESNADTVSYFEHRRNHHMLLSSGNGSQTWQSPPSDGQQVLSIGVYNSNSLISESSSYSLKVSFSSNASSLCPKNCSFPKGNCQKSLNSSSNVSSCVCNSGFAGQFCEGNLLNVILSNNSAMVPTTGIVTPANWTYIAFNVPPCPPTQATVTFSWVGGLPTLVFQPDYAPSLSNNSFEFTGGHSPNPQTVQFSMTYESRDGGTFFFGVYNSDFGFQESCNFSLVLLLVAQDVKSGLPSSGLVLVLVIVILFACVFPTLVVCHVLFLRNVWSGRQGTGASQHDAVVNARNGEGIRTENGLHDDEVNTFSEIIFSPSRFSSVEEATCAVCLSEYVTEDVLRQLPTCSHVFHKNCIDEWFKTHDNCPLCRVSVRRIESPVIETELVTFPATLIPVSETARHGGLSLLPEHSDEQSQ